MIICSSIYGVVDGFFVSNFVGTTAFAAINLTMPILMALATIGFMIGAGGSALVSKTMGEGKSDLANQYFTTLITIAAIIGTAISIVVFIFMPELVTLLKAEGALFDDSVLYSRILLCFAPFFILQFAFQNFLIAAEKPNICLIVNIVAGITNGILDFLFIMVFDWGLTGAALATGVGEVLGAVIPIIFFLRKNNKSLLHLTKIKIEIRPILKAFTNGFSEMITQLSISIVSILYNFQLIKFAGESGIAAFGIIMYVNIIFISLFLGFSIGSAPIISYHYGAENHAEIKNLFRKSLIILSVIGVFIFIASLIFAKPLVMIFASNNQELLNMTVHAFRIYSISYLYMGINAWCSGFFTALNNGLISAVLSFLRTLVFQLLVIQTLPMIIGIDGIWFAIVIAEGLALIVSIITLYLNKNKYHYN